MSAPIDPRFINEEGYPFLPDGRVALEKVGEPKYRVHTFRKKRPSQYPSELTYYNDRDIEYMWKRHWMAQWKKIRQSHG